MAEQSTRNRVCSHRHSFSLDNLFRRLIQSPKKIVGPYINSGDTVIDIGCGPGFFTIPMAEMVGGDGRVIAIDLQPEMLEKVAIKLQDSPLRPRVTLHNCKPDSLELDRSIEADFILAYYMLHETPNQSAFFQQLRQHLKKEGRLLVVEPPFHVSRKAFAESMETARKAGFTIGDAPRRKGGKSMLLTIPQDSLSHQ